MRTLRCSCSSRICSTSRSLSDRSLTPQVDELHSLEEQTDVGVLQQTVARYSEYGVLLAQRLKEQTAAGVVEDKVMDHLIVVPELLSRAIE